MKNTCEVTSSGMGSPWLAGKGDKTLAILLVFFIILLHIAFGSTTPFMVTWFLGISITTPSTPAYIHTYTKFLVYGF